MRFFLDNDVPVSVRKLLIAEGHNCWTAAQAGLADEDQDDNLTVYAVVHQAVLITLDREFTERRRRNPIGRHIRLRCPEPNAAAVLSDHLAEVLEILHRDHVTITVTQERIEERSAWE